MSAINLCTFAVYKRQGDTIKVLAGGQRSACRRRRPRRVARLQRAVQHRVVRETRTGRWVGVADWRRDKIEALQRWRAFARAMRAEFSCVEVEYDVGILETKLLGRAMLRSAQGSGRFANVRRFKAELQLQLIERFARYVDEEGGNPERSMRRTWPHALTCSFAHATRTATWLRWISWSSQWPTKSRPALAFASSPWCGRRPSRLMCAMSRRPPSCQDQPRIGMILGWIPGISHLYCKG